MAISKSLSINYFTREDRVSEGLAFTGIESGILTSEADETTIFSKKMEVDYVHVFR